MSRRTKTRQAACVASDRAAAQKARCAPRGWGPAAALAVITIVAYLPALKGGFVWDDDVYLTSNTSVRSPNGLAGIWLDLSASPQYYPLVSTTFWIEHRLWGLWAPGYHFVNVLLHATVAILFWLVLRKLNVPGAWLAAAIFGLHPVHVESVAWITERKNVLSGVFFLACTLAFLRFDGIGCRAPRLSQRRGWYLLALGLFAASLLSKTATCMLPAVFLVVLWWKKDRVRLSDGYAVIPFVVIAGALSLVTIYVEHKYTTHPGEGQNWSYSLVERGLIAGRALWFYAGKIVCPFNIAFVYPCWRVDAADWRQYLYPLSALAILVAFWLWRARIGTGPLVALLFFGLMAAPVLGFIDIYYMRYALVADHFQYLPSMGLIALFAVLLTHIASLLGGISTGSPRLAPDRSRLTSIPPAVTAVLLLLIGARTWQECRKFHDMETLWRHTLRRNPQAWLALNNLGAMLKDRGEYDEAAELLAEAVQIKPDHANAHLNLANTLIALNCSDEAVQHLRLALEYVPSDGESQVNLANLLADRGQHAEAEAHFRRAIQLLPADALPHYNFGLMLAEDGRVGEAAEQFRIAIQLKPNWDLPRSELSRLTSSRPASTAGAQ